MTGRLKVYDADTGQWSYVDGAGAQANLLRYVPLTAVTLVTQSASAGTGQIHTPTISYLPPNAVAVSVMAYSQAATVNNSHRVYIYHYGGGEVGQVIPGYVVNAYSGLTIHYVTLGGDRQFDFSISPNGAVAVQALIQVTGYWVIDVSTAIASGGGSIIGYGTSFPGAPLVNDRFFRTDLSMEFFWDGTRWLSSELFTSIVQPTGSLQPRAAGANDFAAVDYHGGSDIWLETVQTAFYVSSGGTALSAAHSWVTNIAKVDNVTATYFATVTVNSGLVGGWRRDTQVVNALIGGAGWSAFRADLVKTGTPGTFYNQTVINYRVVAA